MTRSLESASKHTSWQANIAESGIEWPDYAEFASTNYIQHSIHFFLVFVNDSALLLFTSDAFHDLRSPSLQEADTFQDLGSSSIVGQSKVVGFLESVLGTAILRPKLHVYFLFCKGVSKEKVLLHFIRFVRPQRSNFQEMLAEVYRQQRLALESLVKQSAGKSIHANHPAPAFQMLSDC